MFGVDVGPTPLASYMVPVVLDQRAHVPPTPMEGEGGPVVAARAVGGTGPVDPPREVGADLAPGGGIMLEHLCRDLEAKHMDFLGALDMLLEACPEDGWHSLEEHHIACVTLVPPGWT
jgi:hypothetical protein